MEWNFELLPDLGIVAVKAAGDFDYDTMVRFIEAGAAEVDRHGVDGILADLRDVVQKLSPTRVHRLPAVGVAHGLDRRRRIAVVVSPSTAREEDVRVYERIMQSNGLPHHLFTDPDGARAWLLDREGGPS